jgi:drug/metabolite transporter (DMT)-like permease
MRLQLLRSSTNIALLVLVNIFWAMQWTAFKLVGGDVGPISVSFFVFSIAAPVMLLFYLGERWGGRKSGPAVSSDERSFRRWDNLIGFLVVGIPGLTLSSVFAAWGLARTTASNGSLLALTVPIMTALLAAAILHEHMTPARWISLAIALTGVLVLSVKPPESATKEGLAIDWRDLGLLNKDFLLGNALVLASCASSCLVNVCSKGLLKRFSALEVLTYSYLLALAASTVMLCCFEPLSASVVAAYSIRTWTGLLILGGVSYGLAMVLWLFLLTRMDVSQASVSAYLQPFFGVLLASIFLREAITLSIVVGGVITLAGTVLIVSTEDADPTPQDHSEHPGRE